MLGTMPGRSPHPGGTTAGSCWLGLPPQPHPCHVPGLSAEGCVRTDTEAPSLTLPGALPAAGPPGGATAGAGARCDYQRCSYGLGCSFGRLLCRSHEREGRHRRACPCTQVSRGLWCGCGRPHRPPPSFPPLSLQCGSQGSSSPGEGTAPSAHLTPTPPSKKAPSLWSRRPCQLWFWIASEGRHLPRGVAGALYPPLGLAVLVTLSSTCPRTPHLLGDSRWDL